MQAGQRKSNRRALNDDSEEEKREKDRIRASTPRNYLEKIFQIPYVLKRMNEVGFQRLIRGLLELEPEAAGATMSPDDYAQQGPDTAETQATPEIAMESPEAEAEEATRVQLTPKAMTISRAERDFMEKLSPLIGTPRAAKAFVNIYRILRLRLERPATDEPSLDEYLASEQYRVTLLVLALQVGFPHRIRELENDLTKSDQSQPFDTLDAYLDKHHPGLGPGVPHDIRQQWANIARCLGNLRKLDEIPNALDPYKVWVGRVRRFSFQPWAT